MPTIRTWLNTLNFNWTTGTIIIQGVDNPYATPYLCDPTSAQIIAHTDPRLDDEIELEDFHRFIAQDAVATYFPAECNSQSWCMRIARDINAYLDFKKNPTPVG